MMVKSELDFDDDNDNGSRSSSGSHSELDCNALVSNDETVNSRRGLRSRYLAVKNIINDEKEEIGRPESDKFDLIFSEMENLHKLVNNPREQVADAQALLGITKSLVMSVKSHVNGGLTPSDFVSHIIKEFGVQGGPSTRKQDCRAITIAWKDLGLAVSHVFKASPGCCTIIGPMDAKMNQKKAVNRRKRARPTELAAQPEEIIDDTEEERPETDKNMLTMFDILLKNKVAKLENLVLNRNSFAQTVENLFALSFLVKDGRAEIKMNEAGWQLVSPRNTPKANSVRSGDVAFSHFVFRFDFNDWKLMVQSVSVGEELMPHRNEASAESHETTVPKTQISELSGKCESVIQQTIDNESFGSCHNDSGFPIVEPGVLGAGYVDQTYDPSSSMIPAIDLKDVEREMLIASID
ncbi:hypothetical protein RIF29_25128 [Crotalaria pallida]|uniref:Non-structural maintenance of chromosomes element 4 n=1 Tax=Crotalaria pallida TaxID=3830 RepID=A0AAN9ELV0_CROPI